MAFDDDLIGDIPEHKDRRGFLYLLGGGVAVAGAAGWAFLREGAGSTSSSAQAAAGPPRKGGHLIFAFDGAATSRFGFDPHHSGFAPHNRIMRSIYDNLTVLHPDGSVGPWLATGWEVSPDGKTYIFKLRQGVKFHDGTPFDAAAVKGNFDRLADPENALYSRTDIGAYAGGRVIDPQTVEIGLKEPFSPLLRNLSMTKLAMVSPTAAAKGGKIFAQNPVGTGPFRFTGLTQGTEIRLERNPDYAWAPEAAGRQGVAWLDQLTFRNVPEEATRVAVIRSGQANGCDLVPPQNIVPFREDPDLTLIEKELLETNYSIGLNVAKAPWDDVDIRRAVRQSIDVDAIVKTVYFGTFARAWSSLSPSMYASAEKELTGSWKPDVDAAARTFDAKGWRRGGDGIRTKDGKRLTISFIDSQGNREKRLDVIQLVRRQLARNGIELLIDSTPAGSLIDKMQNNQFDMSGGASFHADPDMLRHAYDPAARTAIAASRIEDDEIIAWLREAARESDGDKRVALYHQVQRKIVDQAYAIPIYVLLYNVVTAGNTHGVTLDAHGFPSFYNAWVDA
ncbi:MAG: ABC transporter substrate-binding protein [Sphingobium sp.]